MGGKTMREHAAAPAVPLLLLAAILGVLPSAPAGDKGEEGPVLDAVTAATTRYLPIVFSTHDRHAGEWEIACRTCHHDLAAEGGEPGRCSGCHNRPDAKLDLREAMHASCRGCHLARAKLHPRSPAPTECLGCHTERR